MSRGIRKNITIPGLLAELLAQRAEELNFRTLTPYIFDLVSYDLQSGATHIITVAIAHDTTSAQDAVDAEIARRYRPGQPRQGLLVQVVEHLNEVRTQARDAEPAPPLNAKPARVTFAARLWEDVEQRSAELGYPSLSAYITGLIRYDLLVGGPHGKNAIPINRAKQDAVARKALQRYKRGEKRKLYLDHLLERAQGRALTPKELEQRKAKLAQELQGLFCDR